MKVNTITISVTELQDAVRDYVFKHAKSQPDIVEVDNGYDKTVLYIRMKPGQVVEGCAFQRQTEEPK